MPAAAATYRLSDADEPEKMEGKSLGFFIMAFWKNSFSFWMRVRSHTHYATSNAEFEGLAQRMYARKFKIPLMSIFIGSGDVFNAGAGSADGVMPDKELFRYRLYVVSEEYNLSDGVPLEPSFKLRLREDPSLLGDKGVAERGGEVAMDVEEGMVQLIQGGEMEADEKDKSYEPSKRENAVEDEEGN
eukprot:gb/GEZJ01005501.1/.p1 GENE.gb/GEZJ01005501.1/~~gb/GEZJ01005501.1/.p1  ORF type:complete len:187 (-),score=24.93 gb/GEZJ01005501.1/:137-697(-)